MSEFEKELELQQAQLRNEAARNQQQENLRKRGLAVEYIAEGTPLDDRLSAEMVEVCTDFLARAKSNDFPNSRRIELVKSPQETSLGQGMLKLARFFKPIADTNTKPVIRGYSIGRIMLPGRWAFSNKEDRDVVLCSDHTLRSERQVQGTHIAGSRSYGFLPPHSLEIGRYVEGYSDSMSKNYDFESVPLATLLASRLLGKWTVS